MKQFKLIALIALCLSVFMVHAERKHDMEDPDSVSVEFFKSVFGSQAQYVFDLVKSAAEKRHITLSGCVKGVDVVACGQRKYTGPEGDEISTNRNVTKTATGGAVSARAISDGDHAGKTLIIDSTSWDIVTTIKQEGHLEAYHLK